MDKIPKGHPHVFMAKEHHGIVFKCLSTVSHLTIQDGRHSGCTIANIFSIKTNRNILFVDNPPFSGSRNHINPARSLVDI